MESINFYCEVMLCIIGWEQSQEGSYVVGYKVIQEYWESWGFSWEGVFLDDGSGLLEGNVVFVCFFVVFMCKMAFGLVDVFQAFEVFLLVVGRSGFMKYVLKGIVVEGCVLVKIGMLEWVCVLIGYVDMCDG